MKVATLLYLVAIGMCFAEPNIPTPDIDGIDAVKRYAVQRLREAESQFEKSQHKRIPSPDNWSHDVVYSIQVDRFNNGDFSNDDLNLPPNQRPGSIYDSQADLEGLHNYRHGGDLQGIIDRLDYLQDLGVNSLWITPFLKHNGDYHGYCTASLIEVDPGFGTNELLVDLVQKAHKRGIKVVMDVVINHLCDRKTYYNPQANHQQAVDSLPTGYPSGQGILNFSDAFFPPFKTQKFFNRAGPNSLEEMQANGNGAVYGDFTDGMLDYNTNDYDFQVLFTDFISYWIAYADIDGFRLDAAKHVTQDFIAYFCSKTRNYARSLGKNNFYIIGEVAGPSDWIGSRLGKMFTNPFNYYEHGNIPSFLTNMIVRLSQDSNPDPKFSTNFNLHSVFPHPGLNAAYDFAHGGTARNVFRGEIKLSSLANYFSSDYYLTIAGQSDPRLSWNVLEIHDWDRFLVGTHNQDNYKRAIVSISYIMTAHGIPHLYYGEEQGFNQNGHWDSINLNDKNKREVTDIFQSNSDSIKRQDMFMGPWRLGSAITEIDNLNYVGSIKKIKYTIAEDPFLNTRHSLYTQTKAFIHIRKSCSTLMDGQQYFRYGGYDENSTGVIAFSRILRGEEIIVIINNSESDLTIKEITVDSNLNPSKKQFVNLLNPNERANIVNDARGAKLYLYNERIEAYSIKIFADVTNTRNSQNNSRMLRDSISNFLVCKS